MKKFIKSVLQRIAPYYYDSLMMTRVNRHGQAVMKKHGIPEITKLIVGRCGMQVLSGPFAGMQYISESAGSAFLPKLIGSYESELHGILTTLLSKNYDTVIDVGSAEGYYAVGFALYATGTPSVLAFDVNPEARELCIKLATQNNVKDRIILGSFCDPGRLQQSIKGKSLIICDCEGYEVDLLNPALVPSLANADILVELHDLIKPGITPTLMERFAKSHDIQLIDTADRDPKDYPVIHFLPPQQQASALSEFRNDRQQWAYMTTKTNRV